MAREGVLLSQTGRDNLKSIGSEMKQGNVEE
jgi:hypothetical protein